ncbi:MAG TPA: hypothetical protein VHX38_12150 [Pseudonocardiaceae bacterium]|jgi:hypothetical protein|nr:hypothetical protein [Pseudonocardiaceae bacterium]
MSSSYTLHVRPKDGQPPTDLLSDAGRILDQTFVPHEIEGAEALTPIGVVDCYHENNDLLDDAGIQFSRYPWYLEMYRPRTEEARREVLDQMVRLYGELVATGKYGCALVHNLGQLLATNDTHHVEDDG